MTGQGDRAFSWAGERVIIVGDNAVGGLAGALVGALRRNGVVVSLVNWPHSYINPSTLGLFYRRPSLAAPFAARLRRDVGSHPPVRAVIVVKGALLTHATICRLKEQLDCPVVCWNPDSPFDPTVSNSGGGIPGAIGAYDLYVTWSASLQERIESRRQRCVLIPFGWDPALRFGMSDDEAFAWLRARPVFVGSFTRRRLEALMLLRSAGVVIFGHRWPDTAGLDVRHAVFGNYYASVLRSAGCVINLLRSQNTDSHNMRSFEVPACGGFQIAPLTADHETRLPPSHTTLISDMHGGDLEAAVYSALANESPGDPPTDWLEAHSYDQRVRMLLSELQLLERR